MARNSMLRPFFYGFPVNKPEDLPPQPNRSFHVKKKSILPFAMSIIYYFIYQKTNRDGKWSQQSAIRIESLLHAKPTKQKLNQQRLMMTVERMLGAGW